MYAYLTKDLQPKKSASWFFNGKKLEQALHREHVKSSKHRRGPSRSLLAGMPGKITSFCSVPDRGLGCPDPHLASVPPPHDPKLVNTCA